MIQTIVRTKARAEISPAVEALIVRLPRLAFCAADIDRAIDVFAAAFENDHCLYICGNGGSAADALHIAGELVKPFALARSLDARFCERVSDKVMLSKLKGALPAVALVENAAFSTAFANDCDGAYAFAQQVYALAREGDCALGISTSGNSGNIIHAMNAAKGRGAMTVGLTGESGGMLKTLCDCCICVPKTETYKVQELHMPVYHAICLALEEHFWGAQK